MGASFSIPLALLLGGECAPLLPLDAELVVVVIVMDEPLALAEAMGAGHLDIVPGGGAKALRGEGNISYDTHSCTEL